MRAFCRMGSRLGFPGCALRQLEDLGFWVFSFRVWGVRFGAFGLGV